MDLILCDHAKNGIKIHKSKSYTQVFFSVGVALVWLCAFVMFSLNLQSHSLKC